VRSKARLLLSLLALGLTASAQTPEQRASRRLESLKRNAPLLLSFLQTMPKGGDLHNHLTGSIYAENWIDYAAQDQLCVDRATSTLIAPPCDQACARYSNKPEVRCAYGDHVLYNQLVDAWSMRNWNPGEGSGHDHFFATFDKFNLAGTNSVGNQLAEVASRAAADHMQYLELMHTADGMTAAALGNKLGWDDDFDKMHDRLLRGGLQDVIAATRAQLDRNEARKQEILECSTPRSDPGCQVTVRYLYQVLRGLSREMVFAQIVLGFELAQSDPRFVGLNLVMPEDWYVPMHDFDLHMRMLTFLHKVYPKVHISLHAGELAMGLVRPEGLRFHIRKSIEQGHAERIGHGVSVMHEDDALGLLKEMSAKNVLVEICLTSNATILGVEGVNHPLPTYLKYKVPIALATDDEGVSRSDMTQEYLRAVLTYGFSYADLKQMARQSLEHSFLPGESLWQTAFRPKAQCANARPQIATPSSTCKKLLDTSEKAKVQWQLEKEFSNFENSIKEE
jgi:adenosine deaminase